MLVRVTRQGGSVLDEVQAKRRQKYADFSKLLLSVTKLASL